MHHELKLDCKKLLPLIALSKVCGWWDPYKNHVILQHRHVVLHRDFRGRLHNECDMAVKYRDGWGVYALNGVRVPEWLVLTRAEELDPRELGKITNAQIRAEFVKKVGIDRCFYKLGKVVDKVGHYELGMLDLGDDRARPYLKMLNPSVPDMWHVEGVPIECDTVEKALNFRKPVEMRNIPIREDGESWYQQGDVCVWPKGAASLRMYPSVLT